MATTFYIKQADGSWKLNQEPSAAKPVLAGANGINLFDALKTRATEFGYDIDTTGLNSLNSAFSGATALTTGPAIDTSNVTYMGSMFQSCSKLTSVPAYNTSRVTVMLSMFLGCSSLTSVPLMDTSKVTNASNMFNGCAKLTSVPAFNFSAVTTAPQLFLNCSSLTVIPALDLSAVTSGNFTNPFGGCTSLTSILATGIKWSFSIANAKLDATALNTLFNNLGTVTGQTITITGNPGAATCDKSLATSKGWTVTA